MFQPTSTFWGVLCALSSTLVICIPVIPNYFQASILPEFAMHFPYYARMFASIGNFTSSSMNHTSIDKVTSIYESILNGTKPYDGKSNTDQLETYPSNASLQLKQINDRIILLLVFNNMLLDLIANLEESQKDRLLHKLPTSTDMWVAKTKHNYKTESSTVDNSNKQHRNLEFIPMASNTIYSSSLLTDERQDEGHH